jgi:fructose-1-phosphate kinase PfkB-like protein
VVLIVALNLFVHKTAIVDGLEINGANNIQDYRLVVGDSAVYSAYIIKLLQGEPYVLGIAGGIGGRYIKNYMDKSRIKSDLLWKETETSSELKIIDSINMTETTFIDDNFGFDDHDMKNLKHKFQNNIKDANTVLISSKMIPDGSTNKIIEDIMLISKLNNQKIVISLSGIELRKTLELHPYAAVINSNDLTELELEDIHEEKLLLIALRGIALTYKIKYLIYDNNQNKNIYLISKNKICSAKYGIFVKEPDDSKSKDLIAGVLAMGVARKYEPEKLIKLIAAVKGATQYSNYPRICQRKEVDDLYNKMKLVEIYNSQDK